MADPPADQTDYFVFFLDLVVTIINNSAKSSDLKRLEEPVHEGIEKMLEQMINFAYQILLKVFPQQPLFAHLVGKYGTIVLESRYSQQLIRETYRRLL
jgi:hypothetical protein